MHTYTAPKSTSKSQAD